MPQIDNTEKPGVGTIIAGSAVLGIMGAGGGYLIGYLIDKWTPVSNWSSTTLANRIDILFHPNTKGGFNFGAVYRF